MIVFVLNAAAVVMVSSVLWGREGFLAGMGVVSLVIVGVKAFHLERRYGG